MISFVLDLAVGKAEHAQAGRGQVLIAHAIPFLLDGRAVVPEAVRLDDESEFTKEEVDAMPVEENLRFWLREAGASRDRHEKRFQVGVGEDEGGFVEQRANPARPWPAPLRRGPPQRIRPNQI